MGKLNGGIAAYARRLTQEIKPMSTVRQLVKPSGHITLVIFGIYMCYNSTGRTKIANDNHSLDILFYACQNGFNAPIRKIAHPSIKVV